MRTQKPVGIAGYGAYVPRLRRLRVDTCGISAVWRAPGAVASAVPQKSVPGLDKDVITMAIEAGRTALGRATPVVERRQIGAVWVGTESKPYAVKPSSTVVAEALGLTPHVVAADLEFACKAGSEAMQAACAFVGSGMVEAAVAIGMDTAQARPNLLRGAIGAADAPLPARARKGACRLRALRRHRPPERGAQRAGDVSRADQHGRVRRMRSAFVECGQVASPIGILDAAPICDGAAAVIVASRSALRPHHRAVRVAASTAATDTMSLAARPDILWLGAAARSAARAYEMAKVGPKDVHLFEAHDAFTIITALSLEACGFAPRERALDQAAEGRFAPGGELPIATCGGLKARGHPVGASGIYQAVEAVLQLRNEAGKNQVKGARRAMTQSIGGHGSVAFTHLLEA